MKQTAIKQTTEPLQNILPKKTKSQTKIIKDIYKFRFINTNQFQKIFNHKDPTMVKEWLKDLRDKGYIDTDYKRNDISENRNSAKYFLTPLGRRFLKGQKGFDIAFLERVYKEKGRSVVFKNHCIDIVDMFLFLRSQKDPDEELKFFTQSNLTKFEYFPDTKFDAYIALQKKNKTRRFWLHIFNASDPKWLPVQKLNDYIKYYDENTWQENTQNSSFPVLLFVLPTQSFKYEVFMECQKILQKAITVDIHLFIETKEAIKTKDPKHIWEKVE
jgi:DNA-binding PadR family transcriptional regulator